MKTASLFSICLLISLNLAMTGPTIESEWKTILEQQLSTLLDHRSFSIEDVTVDAENRRLSGKGKFFSISGIQFTAGYSAPGQLADFQLTFPANAQVGINDKSFQQLAGFSLGDLVPNELSKAVYLQQLGFSVSKADKQVEEVALLFHSPLNWTLMPGGSLELNDLHYTFLIRKPTSKAQRSVRATMAGQTRIGRVPVTLTADLDRKKENLKLIGQLRNLQLKESLQAIVGQNEIRGISMPDAVIDLQLQDGELQVQPYLETAAIAAQSNLGKVDAYFQKTDKKDKKLNYVVVIAPPADFRLSKLSDKLKGLDFVDLSGQKIVLTSEDKDKKESSKVPSLSQMAAGIKRGCNLVAKLDLTKLKLEHLLKAKELVVSSPLSEKLDGVVLESEVEAGLSLGANNKFDKVLFRLQPSPRDFAIALVGVMKSQISRDQLLFKGGVEIALATQTLNFSSVMEGNWKDPLGAKGLMMSNVGMQLGGSFGGAAILPNMAFRGELKIGRFSGDAALAFDTRDPSKSLLSAEINQLVIADLMGAVVDPKVMRHIPEGMQKVLQSIRFNNVHLEFVPQPMTVLEKSYDPGFRAGGNVDIMGINGFGLMEIDFSSGILAQGEVDPVDLGVFKLTGAGGNKRPGFIIDMRMNQKPKVALNGLVSVLGIQAETEVEVLPNGFRFDLGGKIFNIFDGKVMVSASDMERLGSMQAKVQMKQDLFSFIDNEVVKFVENEVSGAVQKLTAAQQKISQAQDKVRELDGVIEYQRDVVRKEQAAKRSKYEHAKRDVTNAQNKVNGINREIAKLKKELDGKKSWEVVDKTALHTRIKSMEAARGVAWLALEGYKKVLDGMKFVNSNPDLDQRVVTLIASRHTAVGSLEVAKGSLEALKITLGRTGKVATFIIDKGTDVLINVRKADFAGQLGSVSGGKVKLDLDLEWMNKAMDVNIDFDFHDPLSMIRSLGKKLLD
ncbi:MAG: hypothetical protein R2824_25380 [Saprospiraceae bacterium]|nr:hypothetical protein [Lewinella sp.]